MYKIAIGNITYRFDNLKDVMAKATPARSGDDLAGISASNMEERVAAKMALAEIPLQRFLEEPLIPYEEDEITRLIIDTHDQKAFAPISSRKQSKLMVAIDGELAEMETPLMFGVHPHAVKIRVP